MTSARFAASNTIRPRRHLSSFGLEDVRTDLHALIVCFVMSAAGILLYPAFVFAAFPGVNGRIVFQSNRDGNEEIYVMNADGTAQTNLTNNPAWDATPAWSPDGSKITFSSNRDGTTDIYVMNADGSGVVRVTNDVATDIFPAWSPDGSKIAFARYTDNYDIWTINVDGTGLVNLTNDPTEDNEPAWSPDGSKIAFRTLRGVDFFDTEIYVMNAVDGTGLTNLTNDPAPDASADWSPDGLQILFERGRFAGSDIWVMQADGSGQMALTATPQGDGMPAWSPDDSKIVFRSSRDFNDEIYVMNADGTEPMRLTNNAPPGWTIPQDWFPDWGVVPPPTIDFYLHGTGSTANPPILTLDNSAPSATTAKFKDSAGISFAFGNPWKEVGSWLAAPANSTYTITGLDNLDVFLGLKNSDDQGTQFDVRADVFNNGVLVGSTTTACVTGVTRNPSLAKEIILSFDPITSTPVVPGDVLSLTLSTRIGTNPNGSKCTGPGGSHNNAVGLRVYFDAVSRPARFEITTSP